MRSQNSGDLTRRELLAAGFVTAGALARGLRIQAAPTDASGPYGSFKMGIQSYSLRHYKVDQALELTRELGLHYWESYPAHIPTSTDPAAVAKVKEKTKAEGVSVIGYGVSRFTKDHDANETIFQFAKLMGLGYLSADPTPDSFESLDKLVEQYDVAIGIHNHGPGHQWAQIDKIAAAIKDHHPKIGCCVDTGHFLRSREDPVRAVEVFGKRTYGVHLKDVKDATKFTILGKGDLRLTDLLKALTKLDYDYCLALEYEENPNDPIEDIRACLASVRESVASLKKA